MNRPHIKRGCLSSLLLLLALASCCCCGCLPNLPLVPFPDPHVPVVPVPSTGFKVLIVEDAGRRDRLLPDQVDIFTSATFRQSLNEYQAELRIWNQAVDVENESDAGFKSMLLQPRTELPWLIISGKAPGFSGPLPKSLDETLATIKRFKP